jgi:hypothetical protein
MSVSDIVIGSGNVNYRIHDLTFAAVVSTTTLKNDRICIDATKTLELQGVEITREELLELKELLTARKEQRKLLITGCLGCRDLGNVIYQYYS